MLSAQIFLFEGLAVEGVRLTVDAELVTFGNPVEDDRTTAINRQCEVTVTKCRFGKRTARATVLFQNREHVAALVVENFIGALVVIIATAAR